MADALADGAVADEHAATSASARGQSLVPSLAFFHFDPRRCISVVCPFTLRSTKSQMPAPHSGALQPRSPYSLGTMGLRLLACLGALAALLTACGSHHRPSLSDVATLGIEHQLVAQGGTSAPVHQGTTPGQVSIASRIGAHVVVAVVCEGGGYLQLTLNGKPVGQANCQSTYQTIINVGFRFAAYASPTVIGLESAEGQHWWAAVSGPGGTPT